MKFTFQFFREKSELRAITPDLFPIIMDLPSVEEARSMIKPMVTRPDFPVHSFTIRSEDGVIAEHWFQLNGSWRSRAA